MPAFHPPSLVPKGFLHKHSLARGIESLHMEKASEFDFKAKMLLVSFHSVAETGREVPAE